MSKVTCSKRKEKGCKQVPEVCSWDGTKCNSLVTPSPVKKIPRSDPEKKVTCSKRKEKGCKQVPEVCAWDGTKCNSLVTPSPVNKIPRPDPEKKVTCSKRKEKGCKQVPEVCAWDGTKCNSLVTKAPKNVSAPKKTETRVPVKYPQEEDPHPPKTEIYYFKGPNDVKLRNTIESDKYKFITIDIYKSDLTQIINSKSNILIYGENKGGEIRWVLDSLNPGQIYNNINIINEINESSSILDLVYLTDVRVKKNVNVFIHLHKTKYKNKILRNISGIVTQQAKTKEGEYNIRRLDVPKNTTSSVHEQWWFKWFFNIPSCASGRLVQFTGTCWFNSTINLLLLTQPIAKLMVKSYNNWISKRNRKKFETNATFGTCLTKDTDLHVILYTIIYLVLVKGQKAQLSNANFTSEVAAQINNLAEAKGDKNYRRSKKIAENVEELRNKYGDSGNPIDAIYVILNEMFSTEYLILSNTEYSETIIKWKINPNILVFLYPKGPIYKRITFNNVQYEIQAANIALDYYHEVTKKWVIGHAVAGLRCGEEFYIYDSNNIILNIDWFKNENDIHYGKYTFQGFRYWVYTIVTPVRAI